MSSISELTCGFKRSSTRSEETIYRENIISIIQITGRIHSAVYATFEGLTQFAPQIAKFIQNLVKRDMKEIQGKWRT